jgi:hypothetical protein
MLYLSLTIVIAIDPTLSMSQLGRKVPNVARRGSDATLGRMLTDTYTDALSNILITVTMDHIQKLMRNCHSFVRNISCCDMIGVSCDSVIKN